jgi:hypothetical protein
MSKKKSGLTFPVLSERSYQIGEVSLFQEMHHHGLLEVNSCLQLAGQGNHGVKEWDSERSHL